MEKRKSMTSKVLAVVLAIFISSGGTMGILGYWLNRNAVITGYSRQAMTMAQTAAADIDAELFLQTVRDGEKDGYWQSVKDYLSGVRTETRALWVYALYSDGTGGTRIFADGDDLLGELPAAKDFRTEITADELPGTELPMESGGAVSSGIFISGEYGRAVGGFAPIKDADGAVVGAVRVEISVDEVLGSVNMTGLFIILALFGVGAVFMVLGAKLGDRIIRNPTSALAEASQKLSRGDMNIALNIKSKTELGHLASDFKRVSDTVSNLVNSINAMTEAHEAGDTDALINAGEFEGVYKEAALGINKMIGSYIRQTRDLCHVLREFGGGNFNAEYLLLPGKKAAANAVVEELRKNLKDIDSEIHMLSSAARLGNLDARADAGKHKGDWAVLLSELNALVKSIAEKANWYEAILDAVPMPSFATDMDMKLTFINKAMENLFGVTRQSVIGRPCASLNSTICNTGNCAIHNYRKGITPTKFTQGEGHFVVQAADLKDSAGAGTGFVEIITETTKMDNIINDLNKLVSNVKDVSNQVTDGARQLADSSQRLADGASKQTASIEELNANIDVINEKTKTNAHNSEYASELSKNAKQNAMQGNDQMRQMLSAMEGIKTASGNISTIIKTIEDIAFQTNLLALNAAVEAARAGEHGRGFAVVAEEVRTLAGHSQTAAKETNDLIMESINRVENGTAIAAGTAESLNTIVSDFDAVSKLVSEIAAASAEQAESISLISGGITEISSITQENSASSEETAAASEELASQAEILRNMVIDF